MHIRSNNGLPGKRVASDAIWRIVSPVPVMSTSLRIFCTILVLLACAMPAAGAAAPRDLDLSGSYDDAGTVVIAAPEQSPVVSLHAMLSMEFMPGLARLLQDRTKEVRLTHEGELLQVDVVDHDDETIWRGAWKQGEGFAVRDGRVYLHFKPGRFGNDEFIVILSTVTEHRLLQLEMQRLKPTFFGPVFQPMGTYLFHRM
jgi:hypothetical protein